MCAPVKRCLCCEKKKSLFYSEKKKQHYPEVFVLKKIWILKKMHVCVGKRKCFSPEKKRMFVSRKTKKKCFL